MKIRILIIAALTAIAATSCSPEKGEKEVSRHGPSNSDLLLKGDMTVYGLACEGCNDTAVVLLPNDGSDPISYNVIKARRMHKVIGQLKVGDWIGVIVNPEDSTVADFVVDLDQLKGIWCYMVMPRVRGYQNMTPEEEHRALKAIPDSLKELYFIPREYGFYMKRQWQCSSVGYVRQQSSLEQESPVEYPQLGYFTAWHIWNGKLITTSGTPVFDNKKNDIKVLNERYDTCDIDYLDDDSLVLSSEGISRSYYRKSSLKEVNKKANKMAAYLQKKAQEEVEE